MEIININVKISIITAVFNSSGRLPRLIESLRNQTDKDFEWIVADGASLDGTVDLLNSITDLKVKVTSQPDFGIYDALNRAIKIASGEYYIIAGDDDFFYENAIAIFREKILKSGCEIVSACAMYKNKKLRASKWPSSIFCQSSYISAHTLATAFKKNLHDKYGFYTKQYPIAADQFFVLTVCLDGVSRLNSNVVIGEIGHAGISSRDRIGNATEVFRVQLSLGKSFALQLLLLFLRLIRVK